MFIIRLIKSPKYFYSLMALLFVVFVFLIMFTGRQIYDSEKEKLFTTKTNELNITKSHFDIMMDGVGLELRRLVNTMKQQDLLASPDETEIKSFISDYLFDHDYLRLLIYDKNNTPLANITSESYPQEYTSFVTMPPVELLSSLEFSSSPLNKLQVSKDLNVVYMTRLLTDSVGETDNHIIFFFAPEFLLKHLPANYAFLLSGSSVHWVPQKSSFPLEFTIPAGTEHSGHVHVSDTQTVFYTPLSNENASLLLAAVADTSQIKATLLNNTLTMIGVFSLFFIVIFLLIHFRNIQISQLLDTQKATVVCLANLAEFKDNETADHLERTRHYGTLLSKQLKSKNKYKNDITRDYLENIGFASVLHDIGKVGVPDSILKKPGRLTHEEFEVIKQHTVFAKDILKELVMKHKINDIFFTLSYNIAAYHHEKWDGSGYPTGISGKDIPLEARIFAVCDVYDALRSERVYKDPFSHEKSMSIINEGSGTHFDPEIVDVFNECAEQFRQIHDTYDLFYNEIAYSDYGNNRRELKVEWSPALSVGIDIIDEQHKILLSKINFLIKSILDGKGDESVLSILNFLRSYTEEHFRVEEGLMEEMDHPDLEKHRKAHDVFRKHFTDILSRISDEGVDSSTLLQIEKFLITWLLDHITEMDIKIQQHQPTA